MVQGCFGKGGDITYLDWMLSAWGWTVSVSLLALLVAGVGHWLDSFGILRTLPNSPIGDPAGQCVGGAVRNIPLLVQIFLWYHVPTLVPAAEGVPGFVLVVFAWAFHLGAYCRAGALGHPGAATRPALRRHGHGFTTFQTYRYVLLPMAFRIIVRR